MPIPPYSIPYSTITWSSGSTYVFNESYISAQLTFEIIRPAQIFTQEFIESKPVLKMKNIKSTWPEYLR